MIVLPSRNRLISLEAFFESSHPVEPGVVLLDDDNAFHYDGLRLPDNWHLIIGPRTGYVGLLNRAFHAFPNEPWYAYGGDDVRCRPAGWDTFLAHAAGSNKIAYGDDCINGASACCLPFIGGDLVRKVGWLGCPVLGHLFCDTVWHEIGKSLEALHYYPEIVTEHCHWSTGKQPYDATAAERQLTGDREAFEEFMAEEVDLVVQRCRA